MTEKDKIKNNCALTRRQLLAGVGGAGAAALTGTGVQFFVNRRTNVTPETLTDEIYIGSSEMMQSFSQSVDFRFLEEFQELTNSGLELELGLHEYPSGNTVHSSLIPIKAFDRNGDVEMIVNSDKSDDEIINGLDVIGNVSEDIREDHSYELDVNGQILNLTEGFDGNIPTDISTKLDIDYESVRGLMEDSQHASLSLRATDRFGNKKVIRQTDPFNVQSLEYENPVSIPTGAKQEDGGRFIRASKSGRYVISYDWRYDGDRYGIIYPVQKLSYSMLRNQQPRYESTIYHQAHQSPYGRQLGYTLYQMANEAGGGEELAFNLARTLGQTWPYERDWNVYNNIQYSNFALEALVEGTGDCVDHSAILISILSQPPFNYDVVMAVPPNHLAPAVKVSDIPVEPVEEDGVIQVDGEDYAYLESTGVREVGDPGRRDLDKMKAVYKDRWREISPTSLTQSTYKYVRTLFER